MPAHCGKQSLLARNRAQARRAFPVFHWILQCRRELGDNLPEPGLGPYGSAEMIVTEEMLSAAILFRRAVDHAQPLLGALCRMFGVPKWVVRHLEGSGVMAVLPYSQNRMDLPRHLARLAPEHAPNTWSEYHALLSLFASLSTGVTAGRFKQPFLRSDLQAIGRQIRSEDKFWDRPYSWFLEAIAWLLDLEPEVWKETIYEALGDPSIAEWLALVRRFARVEKDALGRLAAHRKRGLKGEASTGGDWLPLIPEWVRVDGLDFYTLSSLKELESEGAALRHCVADHAADCAQGASHIVAVRSSGVRFATIEIVPGRQGGKLFWMLNQSSGPSNSPVPEPTGETIEKFVEQLNLGLIPLTEPIVEEAARQLPYLPTSDDDGGPDLPLVLRVTNAMGASAADLFRPALEAGPGRGQLYHRLRQSLERKPRTSPPTWVHLHD